jgi:hypothetical protein
MDAFLSKPLQRVKYIAFVSGNRFALEATPPLP